MGWRPHGLSTIEVGGTPGPIQWHVLNRNRWDPHDSTRHPHIPPGRSSNKEEFQLPVRALTDHLPHSRSSLRSLREVICQVRYKHSLKPFVIEPDTSDIRVGAILLQQFGEKQKLHRVPFYSKKLIPGEWNYDVGNRELLVIKMALKEWRHWLGGAFYPFTTFTNHKNLEYLKTAEHLNSHPAQWALFFTCFQFSIEFHLILRMPKLTPFLVFTQRMFFLIAFSILSQLFFWFGVVPLGFMTALPGCFSNFRHQFSWRDKLK